MTEQKNGLFQSTRLSRASTAALLHHHIFLPISIHKALTSLDGDRIHGYTGIHNFNPQGSHEPRRSRDKQRIISERFQSTRLSRASTFIPTVTPHRHQHFNPQGSHEPRRRLMAIRWNLRYFNPQGSHEPRQQKYTIILASMPNLYILIIHLQQIIQQVKKFSRILILFSGRLQCESPWNFMCNYYSHQSFLTKNQPSFKLPPLSICAKFSRTILNNHLKWRSQLTVYPAVYYVLSRSKNSNVFT